MAYGPDVVGRLCVLCVLWLLPYRVSAAELHWEAPEGCPDLQDLERETEQVLGESLAHYPLQVWAVVVTQATQLSLELRMQVPVGEPLRVRELQATRCSELMEAAAVAIALAAAESGRASPPLAAADTRFDPGPPEAPPRLGATRPPASQTTDTGVVLGAAAVSDWGALPGPGLGAELQLGWRLRWLRLGIAGSWLPQRSMPLARGTRAAFGLTSAALSLCMQQRVARTQLMACGLAELGQISAQLLDAGATEERRTPWRALGLRLSLTYPLAPPLEMSVSLAAIAPLTRPEFFRDERESLGLHQPAKVGARLWLGVIFSP